MFSKTHNWLAAVSSKKYYKLLSTCVRLWNYSSICVDVGTVGKTFSLYDCCLLMFVYKFCRCASQSSGSAGLESHELEVIPFPNPALNCPTLSYSHFFHTIKRVWRRVANAKKSICGRKNCYMQTFPDFSSSTSRIHWIIPTSDKPNRTREMIPACLSNSLALLRAIPPA